MTNIKYGKLENDHPYFFVNPIKLEADIVIDGITHAAGTYLFTSSEEVIMSFGYLPVIFTSMPAEKEGYYHELLWVKEEGQIIQTWIEKELPKSAYEDYYNAVSSELGENV